MSERRRAKLGRDEFAEVVKRAPLASIDLVVKNSRREMLVGLRKNEPAKGFWFVPGVALAHQLMSVLQAQGRGRDGTQAMVDVIRQLAEKPR